MPKVELTNFDGTNLITGVRKCEKYFHVVPVEQKIYLTSLYPREKANIWFQGWQLQEMGKFLLKNYAIGFEN